MERNRYDKARIYVSATYICRYKSIKKDKQSHRIAGKQCERATHRKKIQITNKHKTICSILIIRRIQIGKH